MGPGIGPLTAIPRPPRLLASSPRPAWTIASDRSARGRMDGRSEARNRSCRGHRAGGKPHERDGRDWPGAGEYWIRLGDSGAVGSICRWAFPRRMGPHTWEGGPILFHAMACRLLRRLWRGRRGSSRLAPPKPRAGPLLGAGGAARLRIVAPGRAHFRRGRRGRLDLAHALRHRGWR